jgi:hypothetical protein
MAALDDHGLVGRATASAPRLHPSRLVAARRAPQDNDPLRVTFSLTFVPISDTIVTNLAHLQDGRRVTPAAGASAVPAGGGSSLPFSGGFGFTPGRHHDRSARSSLDWDRTERVTPAEKCAVFRTIGTVRADRVPGSACWS